VLRSWEAEIPLAPGAGAVIMNSGYGSLRFLSKNWISFIEIVMVAKEGKNIGTILFTFIFYLFKKK
jgi:hypothetical protein